MKNIAKSLGIFLTILGCFFSINVHAEPSETQLVSDTDFLIGAKSGYTQFAQHYYTSSTRYTVGSVKAIRVRLKFHDGNNSDCKYRITKFGYNFPTAYPVQSNESYQITSTEWTDYYFTFPTSTNDSQLLVGWEVYGVTNGSCTNFYDTGLWMQGTLDPLTNPNRRLAVNPTDITDGSPTSTGGYYYEMWKTGDVLPTDSDIQIKQETEAICDFSYWNMSGHLSTADQARLTADYPNKWTLGVVWTNGYDPNGNITDYDLYAQEIYDRDTFSLLGTDPFIKKSQPWTDTTTVFYATPIICDSQTPLIDCFVNFPSIADRRHIVAQGTTREFIVNPTGTCSSTWQSQDHAKPEYASSTNPADLENVRGQCYNWCDKQNIAVKYLCSAMCALFMPSDSALQNFASLKEELSVYPPFGYIAIYASSTQNMTTSTATTTANFALIGDFNITKFFRTGMAWIFYLLFGIWVIKRLTNFSLHG